MQHKRDSLNKAYIKFYAGKKLLKTTDFKNLYNGLYEIRSKWKQLGVELGVSLGTIESIKDRCHKPEDCFYEMLHEWLKSGNATCECLLDSLRQPTVGGAHLIVSLRQNPLFEGE